MNTNIKWLKETIATKSRSEMPEQLKESYETYKEFSDNWTDYSLIEEEPSTLETLGIFRNAYERLMPETTKMPKRKATSKGRSIKAKGEKATAKIKKAKANRKANAKPRPKKETPAASTTAAKGDGSSSKKEKKSKPANRKPKTVNPKPAKPEKVKKPTADEKAADKARAEIRVLDRDIAAYEKRIKDDSGIVDRIAASWMDQSKSIKSTLGALPNDLREELLMKRRKKAILAKIIKRDAKYFESAAKTLKKANQLPDRLAADLESVSMTLGSLNRKAADKKAPKSEKKGFFGKIFG